MHQKFLIALILSLLFIQANAQLRQIHSNLSIEGNNIKRISFYTPSTGYIASTGNPHDWIGYTTDSGRTLTKREITLTNVDYGTYSVNLTFGFMIEGVVAFDANNVLAYGNYGYVPAILKSSNGGLSYQLVYHNPIGPNIFSSLFNLVFPQNNQTGYAVDGYNILKTTNGGTTWTRVYTGSTFSIGQLDAIDNNTVFAFSDDESATASTGKLIKTTNAGNSWTQLNTPDNRIYAADFLTPEKGWLNVYLNADSLLIYYTSTGGVTWTKKNMAAVNPIGFHRMHFVDDSTGYGVANLFYTFKTSDSGRIWEPLPRDNSFNYLNYGHTEIHFANSSQFWSAGAREFIELTTNGGGVPLPRAYFTIDTSGLYQTGTVKLQNYSKASYTHKWYRNNELISTSYHANFQRVPSSTHDSIKLVVSNGVLSDSLTLHQHFWPPVSVTSFTPTIGASGAVINISGQNFTNVVSVFFGNVPASTFTVNSAQSISATVAGGASGFVKVLTANSRDSLAGFTFIPAPTISSFLPVSATAGTTITILGTNLTGATSVIIGGVSAVFSVNSATQITATAPSGPSGSISVTTPGGSATLSGYSSLPGINTFSPTSGTIGTILSITGSSLTGTTAVTIGGVAVSSFTVNNANSITAIVSTGATGPVAITRPEGSASLPGFTWIPAPVITSFTPQSDPVGTNVTITGTGFNNNLTGNTVYFGGARANIVSASSTQITVTVPYSAGYSTISVTANNLSGYSTNMYLTTFSGGGSITQSSFGTAETIQTGFEVLPFSTGAADFDLDGKSELIVLKLNNPGNTHGVLIYKNTGTGSAITMGTPIELAGGNESFATGDVNGDGKTDIILSGAPYLYTYINTSSAGNLSFAPVIMTSSTLTLQRIRLADMDVDGKPDVICSSNGNIYVIRNISEPTQVNYAEPVMIFTASFERNFIPADLTGDGKPELIMSGFGVLRNNSSPGTLNFTLAATLPLYNHSFISTGDIDGDGKLDVVSGDRYGSQINVIRNTSSGSNISFATPVSYQASSLPAGSAIGDLDGDGKPDIAVSTAENAVTLFKNISVPGSVNLLSPKSFVPGTYSGENQVALADFNNDGKSDIAISSENPRTVFVLRNEVKADPSIISFTPTIGENGTAVTITGTNFTGATAVRFGAVPASSFVVNSPTSITAVVGSGASGFVTVVTGIGIDSLPGFVYGIPPVITSVSPSSGHVGTMVTINGSNFSTNPSDNIIYFGRVKAQALTATSTTITTYVPPGSDYAPVSVTKARLTGWSNKPFLTTFPNNGSALTTLSFANRINIGNFPVGCLVDFDGDGKLDVAGVLNTSTVAIARNISVPGQIRFAPAVVLSGTIGGGGIMAEDFDGDGKKDLLFIQNNIQLMLVKNNSTPGNIVVAGLYSIPSGNSGVIGIISARDIDKDGKPDILFASYSGAVNIIKNNCSGETINFSPHYYYPLGNYGLSAISTDVDDDGNPDLLAASGELAVFRNTSTPGNIIISPRVGFSGGDWPTYISTGDLDGDGRTDALVSQSEPNKMAVFKNLSAPGAIVFSVHPELPSGNHPYTNGMNDLSGDGKPDIFAPNLSEDSLSIFTNNSTPGSLVFAPHIKIASGNVASRMESADLDGDGRPDIIISGNSGPATIIRNQHSVTGPQINNFSPVSATASATITITGERFTDISNVTFGGVPASSFNVISTTRIEAIVGNGASGPVSVHSTAGISSLTGFIYGNKPVLSSFMPETGFEGSTITINGANLTGTTAVNFGNTPAASFVVNASGTSISAVVGNGNSGQVKLVTPAGSDSLGNFIYLTKPTISSFSPLLGNAGSTVVITGTNFNNVSAVLFGGASAISFTVVSETSISAIVGNGHTGQIEVITAGGSAFANGFIYNNSASISDFNPKSAGTGSAVYLYGFNLASVTSVKFGGVPASSFTIESPTRIKALVGTGASGEISVTNHLYTTSKPGFTFLNGTVPSITAISPVSGSTGSVITISGKLFTGVSEVRFGNSIAEAFEVLSDSMIIATVGSGSTGLVTLLSPGGAVSADGFTYSPGPVINSFYPVSAPPLTPVTIVGQNFSNTISGNTVFFGTVKATVTEASPNYLIVKVPYGAKMSPITVTSGQLTAYSSVEFIPTFNGSSIISPDAYIRSIDSTSPKTPSLITLGDLDLDSKPDIVVSSPSGSTLTSRLSFHLNVSSSSNIWLAPRTSIHTPIGPYGSTYADFNNDGKPEIAASGGASFSQFILFPNNSSPGNLSWGTTLTFPMSPESEKCFSADFDKDGKTDIGFLGGWNGAISIYRNTGNATTFSFSAAQVFSTFLYASSVAITDLDGDGKPDIVVAGGNSTMPTFHVLKNTSTNGSITFQTIVLNLPFNVNQVLTGDLDNDNKPEVLLINFYDNKLLVLKNQSIPGFVLLETVLFLPVKNPGSIALADISGDGKPDLCVADTYNNYVSVLANRSDNTGIRFGQPVSFFVSNHGGHVTICDMDADGRPELVRNNPYSYSISIMKNNQPVIDYNNINLCANGNTTINAGMSGTIYQWQQDDGNGFMNITNNSNFSGSTTATLQLTGVPVTWHNYRYRCVVNGTLYSSLYRLIIGPVITPIVSISGNNTVASGQSAALKTTLVNGGSSPQYQWQDSTGAAGWQNINGAVNSTQNYTPSANGVKIRCQLTSNAICATPSVLNSNVITFTINPVTAVDPVPASDYGIRAYPNPVTGTLYLDSLKISDKWTTAELITITGTIIKQPVSLSGRTGAAIELTTLPQGYYLLKLNRKHGPPALITFIKL